ncbi:mCG146236, partial [Mus musculus]
ARSHLNEEMARESQTPASVLYMDVNHSCQPTVESDHPFTSQNETLLKCSGSYGPARPSRRERMMAVVSDKALGRLKCHGQDSIELGICGWLTYKLT